MFKKLDSNWIVNIFDILVIAAYYFEMEQGLYAASLIYKIAAVCLCIFLFPILNMAYDKTAMGSLMSSIINSPQARKYAIKRMQVNSFWKLPQLIHIICGIIFIWFIQDVGLTMAFLVMTYYFRIAFLIISSQTIGHLKFLEEDDPIGAE